MEINNDIDIDSLLLQQFSSMATQDRDVLVAEFQKLLGDQLNGEGCAFFLDMNNWNLQAAICSYFECQQDVMPGVMLPKMSLIIDEASQESHIVPPNTTFTKTWRILNIGHQAWPPGCCLRFIGGSQMTTRDRVMVDALEPSSATEVTLELNSPEEVGSYKGEWRMSTITGTFFGDYLWVTLNVCSAEDSQLFDGLASEMSRASMDDDEGGQASGAGFIPAVNASGQVPEIGFPSLNHVVCQSPDSLRTLAMTQASVTTRDSDVDTMEMS